MPGHQRQPIPAPPTAGRQSQGPARGPSAANSNSERLARTGPDLNEGVAWEPAPALDAVRNGATLRLGHEGEAVGQVQRMMGTVAQTKRFGRTTQAAVAEFQRSRGLTPASGQIGRTTLDALEGGQVQAAPLAVWTTGGSGSRELPTGGRFSPRDFLAHHHDRTNSDAADRVRAGTGTAYESVDAYDFTFERQDRGGRGVEGTAFGLPLRVPTDARVLDVQATNAGSGGYGKFILLEYVDTKERVEIHHLAAVGNFKRGQLLSAGTVFGAQGGSGSRSNQDYAAHVDIVGTSHAVETFVRANATGKFRTNPRAPDAGGTGMSTAGTGTTAGAAAQGPDQNAGIQWTDAPSLDDVRAGKATLRLGHRGDAVRRVQELVSVGRTGDFGNTTRGAVASFQRAAGLAPPAGQEGTVGKTTLDAMLTQGAVGKEGAYGVAGLAIASTPDAGKWSAEIRALLRAISYAEGAEDAAGYQREVGGKEYPATTRVHPGAENTRRYTQTGYNSDAFGRYQMLSSTWAGWAKDAGVPTAKSGHNNQGEAYYDISPRYQDQAVLTYLRNQGVERYLRRGDVHGAIAIPSVASQWASLPTYPDARSHNGRTKQFYAVYDKMLGEEQAADRQRAGGGQ